MNSCLGEFTVSRRPDKQGGDLYDPYILYKGKQVWALTQLIDQGTATVAETKDGNVVLVYQQQVGAGGSVAFVVIHPDGKVLFQKEWSAIAVDAKAVNPEEFVVRLKHPWDPVRFLCMQLGTKFSTQGLKKVACTLPT